MPTLKTHCPTTGAKRLLIWVLWGLDEGPKSGKAIFTLIWNNIAAPIIRLILGVMFLTNLMFWGQSKDKCKFVLFGNSQLCKQNPRGCLNAQQTDRRKLRKRKQPLAKPAIENGVPFAQ